MHKKIFIALLLFCVGCGVQKSENDNEAITKLDYDLVSKDEIGWYDIFNRPDDRYLVYFYSNYCGYCRINKEDILSYYIKKVEKIYFVDAIKENAIYGNSENDLIGMKRVEDFYIPGTPTLIEITNYTITNLYVGVDNIRLYLN